MTGADYYRHRAHRMRSPQSWSTATRRLFLLTLPIASILWLLLIIGYSLLAEMAGAADVLGTFWNGDRDRRTIYDLGARTDGPHYNAPRGVRPEFAPLFA